MLTMILNRKKRLNLVDFTHFMCSEQLFKKERAILQYSSHQYRNTDKFHLHQNKLGHNAVYNIAYSREGNIVLAGYEGGSISAFHPLIPEVKPLFTNENAHLDSVNGFHFISSTKFASCSDDTTVKIWDVRFFRNPIQTLTELSDWAKNIHYNSERKLLITSALHKRIAIYELNNDVFQPVILLDHKNDLLRTALMRNNDTLFLTEYNTGRLHCIKDFDKYLQRIREHSKEAISHWRISEEDLTQTSYAFEASDSEQEAFQKTFVSSLTPHPLDWCIAVRGIRQLNSTNYTCVFDMHSPSNGCSKPTAYARPTLTHYHKESNVRRDFIKEISFSCDGRVIASPLAKGFRLFGFGTDCPHYAPIKLNDITELTTIYEHYDRSEGYVYTAKFSPTDYHLVIGCSKGTVKFCYPRL
ncbi:unnamed protein product [Dimorphilus gyrociliatus]|uniref:Uncharacterized protein n=1 Tax=Dimorphilus gyrociliatus TaxID=2664684 RepID=A0A7I8V8Y0_9ANNE|nr:unnamed protein product [Dimorphilus gyrociliatus]